MRVQFNNQNVIPLKKSRNIGTPVDVEIVAPEGYNGIGRSTLASWGTAYTVDGTLYYNSYRGGPVSLGPSFLKNADTDAQKEYKAKQSRELRDRRNRDNRLFNDDVAEYEKAKADKLAKSRKKRKDERDQLRAGAARIEAQQEARAEAFRRGATGALPNDIRGNLVSGLALEDFTEELISMLQPDDVISFEVIEEDGVTYYLDAILFPNGNPALAISSSNNMNFPTASLHSEENGTLIARIIWVDEGGQPNKWIAYEDGIWILYGPDIRRALRNDDLDEADYRATDWRFPPSCSEVAAYREPIGGLTQAEEPTFDIANPPCKVG